MCRIPGCARTVASPPRVGLTGNFELAVDKNHTLHGVLVAPDAERLRALAELSDLGVLRPPQLEVFGLEEIVAAHVRIEGGHGRGKVVIDLDDHSPPISSNR